MCGIVGSINYSLDISTIKKAMFHRGPDEQNHFQFQNLELYVLRLAIQDIENGQQPQHLSNRFTIIFNGEIFNHRELRKQYQLKCSTDSDTETLLHLYQKSGENFLQELDGMFAMAIFDKEKNELFLARDRAGEKPLYLFREENKLVFASELNTLRSIIKLEINNSHISNYLRLGFHFRSQTPYRNVIEIENGHWAKINLGNLKMEYKKWWDVHHIYQRENTLDFSNTINKTESLLKESVLRRMVTSDLEVGAFLSGGIDSGLVVAMASEINSNLKTFTVSFSGIFDEAPLAKLVAERYKTDHTEINISFDNLQHDVEKIIGNYGEPFYDSSAIPSYYVSEAAKKYVSVVLNGDGADELFGGYRRYVPFRYFDLFNSSKIRKHFFKSIAQILPISHNKKSKYNHLYRLIDLLSKNDIEKYLTATSDIFEGYEEYLANSKLDGFQNLFSKILKGQSRSSGLKKIMNLDFEIALVGDFLVKMDIATMAKSLEGRSPFLGKEILEFAPTIGDEFKINKYQTKYGLRQLAKKYLPETLIHQPKRGFEVPLRKWVEGELKEVIFSKLNNKSYAQNFVDINFIQKLKENKINISREKRAKILWTLFTLEVWNERN